MRIDGMPRLHKVFLLVVGYLIDVFLGDWYGDWRGRERQLISFFLCGGEVKFKTKN